MTARDLRHPSHSAIGRQRRRPPAAALERRLEPGIDFFEVRVSVVKRMDALAPIPATAKLERGDCDLLPSAPRRRADPGGSNGRPGDPRRPPRQDEPGKDETKDMRFVKGGASSARPGRPDTTGVGGHGEPDARRPRCRPWGRGGRRVRPGYAAEGGRGRDHERRADPPRVRMAHPPRPGPPRAGSTTRAGRRRAPRRRWPRGASEPATRGRPENGRPGVLAGYQRTDGARGRGQVRPSSSISSGGSPPYRPPAGFDTTPLADFSRGKERSRDC